MSSELSAINPHGFITQAAGLIPRSLVLLLCLMAIGTRADIPNAVYQAPQEINAADRQAALNRIDRFVAKLKELEAEIDRSNFDLPAVMDQQDFDQQKFIAFVRDEIRFEQYAGLLRGAEGTLVSGAGNSLDQAVLLATLLNDAGFEARIVRGRLENEQARQLLSGIGRPAGNATQLAGNSQAWDAKSTELHEISGAPAPQQYPPVNDAPFYASAQRTTKELIQALHAAFGSNPGQARAMIGRQAIPHLERRPS
jgi:hypothetical protein